MSTPPAPRPSLAPPIDTPTCIALIQKSLLDSREKSREIEAARARAAEIDAATPHPPTIKVGITIDLSHHKIASLPVEGIELIREEIERSVVLNMRYT